MEYLYGRRLAGGNLPWRSVRPFAVTFLTVRSLIIGASVAFLVACATTGDSSSPFIREDAAPADGVQHRERPADEPGQPAARPDRAHRPERPADGPAQPAARPDRVRGPAATRAYRTERDSTSLNTAPQKTGVGGVDPGLGYHRHSSQSTENLRQQLFETPLPPQMVHTADAPQVRGDPPAETPNGIETDEQVPLLLSPADPHISESPRILARRHAAGETVGDALSGYHSRRPASGSFTMPMLAPDLETVLDPVEDLTGNRGDSDHGPDSERETESESAGDSSSDGESGVGTDADSSSAPEVPVEPDGSQQPDRESQPASGTDRADESTQERVPHPADPVQNRDQRPSDGDETTLESSGADQDERPAEEEYRVAVGENLRLSLPGDGWLFVGADSAEADSAEAVDLVDRRSTGEQTEFEIAVETAGEHRLSFQRQDVGTGSIDRHTVRVVGSDDPFDRTPVPDRVPSPAARSVEESTGVVDVEGILDWNRTDPPAPSHEALVDEYADLDDSALLARLESAVTDSAADRIAALLEAVRERAVVPQPLLLSAAADGLHAAGRNDAAAEAYRWWISEYDGEVDSGDVHFALAAIYEESATTADIRRSVEHYTAVAERYPRNEHASTAESRARRLRRHFVDIR